MTLWVIRYMARLYPWIKDGSFQGFYTLGFFFFIWTRFAIHITDVYGVISVFTPCASNWDVTHFACAWICTRKVRELSWFSGRVYRSKSPSLLPAVLPKIWASLLGSPAHCSNILSALAMKKISVNWMAKTVFQAFFLNEQNPNAMLVVVFIWLFGGSVASTEGMVAVRHLTHSCPALGTSMGLAVLPCPQGHMVISQADLLFSLNLIHDPSQRPNAQESTVISVNWDLPDLLCQFKEKENMRKLSSFKWGIVK